MLNFLHAIFSKSSKKSRGQSFLELALVLPILLLMLLGLVEVAFFMSKYLDALDLTREAARFASIRDPFSTGAHDFDCSTQAAFDFYYDTSCIFSAPETTSCVWTTQSSGFWCNGLNKYLSYHPEPYTEDGVTKQAYDDVVISIYTVGLNNEIEQTHPVGTEFVTDENGDTSYYWALSNHFATGIAPAHDHLIDKFKYDCQGTKHDDVLPYYTRARVQAMNGQSLQPGDFPSGATPTSPLGNKGFVAVELYYCHAQVLGLPIITNLIPNPIRIHASTIMPIPAAAPTPTIAP